MSLPLPDIRSFNCNSTQCYPSKLWFNKFKPLPANAMPPASKVNPIASVEISVWPKRTWASSTLALLLACLLTDQSYTELCTVIDLDYEPSYISARNGTHSNSLKVLSMLDIAHFTLQQVLCPATTFGDRWLLGEKTGSALLMQSRRRRRRWWRWRRRISFSVRRTLSSGDTHKVT